MCPKITVKYVFMLTAEGALSAGFATGLGWADPALGPAALAAPPPDLGSPLAFKSTAFSQLSLICERERKIQIKFAIPWIPHSNFMKVRTWYAKSH